MPDLPGRASGRARGPLRPRVLLALRAALRGGARAPAAALPRVHHAAAGRRYEADEDGAVGLACRRGKRQTSWLLKLTRVLFSWILLNRLIHTQQTTEHTNVMSGSSKHHTRNHQYQWPRGSLRDPEDVGWLG